MIFVKLLGGIGNQMFQYAAARRLAHVSRTTVIFDISHFKHYTERSYALGNFEIQEQFASHEEVAEFTLSHDSILKYFFHIFNSKKKSNDLTYIKEKYFHFDPTILHLGDNVYLDGYWQSEKYFADIASVIQQEFMVTTPQEGRNQEVANNIRACNAVSIHIRRGDFISNPEIHKVHGTCELDYYARSVDYIVQTVDGPHFFVFSDDPKWVSHNVRLSHPNTIVEHNGVDNSYEDLRLMSQCKHHIIANSSFSWWGAWLNPNREKIVIAPPRWFQTEERNTKDLLPESWVKL